MEDAAAEAFGINIRLFGCELRNSFFKKRKFKLQAKVKIPEGEQHYVHILYLLHVEKIPNSIDQS
jgi:hypothetical protein